MKRFFEILAVWFLLVGSFSAAASEPLMVREDEVTNAIKKEFLEQGVQENLDLEFFGGKTNFQFDAAEDAKILVTGLKLDELNNKFSCNLEVFADGRPFEKTEIYGKYYVLEDIYVPSRIINKGEVIDKDSLEKIRLRRNRIKPANVVEKDKLEGKQAKKTLAAGKLVTDREIGVPVLVKKGQIVNIVYKTSKMQIMAKVEALNDGGKGEKIEVMNTKSKKVVSATVIDADTVEAE